MSVSVIVWQAFLLVVPALVVAMGGLLVFQSRHCEKTASAWLSGAASVLLALAVASYCSDLPIIFSIVEVLLALACCLPLVGNLAANLEHSRIVRKPRRWDVVLLGLSPVFVVGAFWQLNSLTAFEPVDLSKEARPTLFHQKAREIAYTDRGRAIPLFELKPESKESFPIAGDAGLALAGTPLPYQAIRLTEASGDSNCVGWVFTGGRYEMQCIDVGTILEDNGYTPVQTPRVGDLVIYRDDEKVVTHLGAVALFLKADQPLIESKWGSQGVFLHLPEGSPFGSNWTYYRSARPNHHLLPTFPSSKEESAHSAADAAP
jgi:hypothetical protein